MAEYPVVWPARPHTKVPSKR